MKSVFPFSCLVLTIFVQREVASAIYSGIPGASLQSVQGLGSIWVIPCDAEINVAFKFGGQTYPVHPLDTNSDDALANPDGRVCLGAVCPFGGTCMHCLNYPFQFQPISSGASPYYDMILGTSFRKFCESHCGLRLCLLTHRQSGTCTSLSTLAISSMAAWTLPLTHTYNCYPSQTLQQPTPNL